MLKILQKKNPHEEGACRLYSSVLTQIRQPSFYREMGLSDSMEARFDLMALHVFLVMERLLAEGRAGRDFNQALFDAVFADMDQTLREMGIGDMGVPKRMRRLMKGFNGRMNGYQKAFAAGGADIDEALRRNVYGTMAAPEAGHLQKMAGYAKTLRSRLAEQSAAELMQGVVRWG